MKKASFIILMLAGLNGFAQNLKATINNLAFMQGKWVLKHQWGDMEEYWSAPMGDNMVSSYRCVKDGKIIFYEFVIIEQHSDSVVMLLRHFKPGSIGWEDKDSPQKYPLIAYQHSNATFQSEDASVKLTYHLLSKDKLDVVLNEKDKSGKIETTVFHYHRNKY